MSFDAGLSFQPGQAPQQGAMGRGGSANPVQDAIRVLSLRFPTLSGGANPFPQAGAPGSQGIGQQGFAQLLQQLIRNMGQGMPAAPGQSGMNSLPAPTTAPGILPGDRPQAPAGGYQGNFSGSASFDPSQRSPNTGINGGGNPSYSGPTPGVDQGGLKPPVGFSMPAFQLWR